MLLHFADACCAARVAIPPTGKEPRNFGLHRVKQLAVVRRRAEIIQLPPATPSSRRRARREAIGLPRFGDLEDLKAVVDSA